MTFDRTASEPASAWTPHDPALSGAVRDGVSDAASESTWHANDAATRRGRHTNDAADGTAAPAQPDWFAHPGASGATVDHDDTTRGAHAAPAPAPAATASATAAPSRPRAARDRAVADDNPLRRFFDHDGTPEGQTRRPQYRHGTVLPEPWFAILFNPAKWRVGGWALFGALLTALADFIAFLYISNILGVGAKVEMEMWLLIAGITGFATITAALWAIWKNSRRATAIWALVFGLLFGAAPAWLVANTIIQFIINGGSLPVAPPLW